MMFRALSALFIGSAGLGLMSASVALSAESPLGVWIDDSGRGAVEIVQCGDKLCGKLVWLKDSKNAGACGTAILGDVPKTGESWDGGWIYSPEKKAKYDVELTPDGSDKLTVLGYAGTKLFSREMTWTRAPADLKRCDMQEAKASDPASTAAGTPGDKSAPPAQTEAPATAGATGTGTEAQAEPKPEAERTQTAQAEVPPTAQPSTSDRAKTTPRRKMCRVDAPYVRVEFPCDDD